MSLSKDEEIARLFQYFDAAHDMAVQAKAFHSFTGRVEYANIAAGSENAAKAIGQQLYALMNNTGEYPVPKTNPYEGLRGGSATPQVQAATPLIDSVPNFSANSMQTQSTPTSSLLATSSLPPTPLLPPTQIAPAVPKTAWKIPAGEWKPGGFTHAHAPTPDAIIATSLATLKNELNTMMDTDSANMPPQTAKTVEQSMLANAPSYDPNRISPVASWKTQSHISGERASILSSAASITDNVDGGSRIFDGATPAATAPAAAAPVATDTMEFRKRFTSVNDSPKVFTQYYDAEKQNKWVCDQDTASGYPRFMEQVKFLGETTVTIPSGLVIRGETPDTWSVAFYINGDEMFRETGKPDIGKISPIEGMIIINKWTITWIRQGGVVTVRSIRYHRDRNPLSFTYAHA